MVYRRPHRPHAGGTVAGLDRLSALRGDRDLGPQRPRRVGFRHHPLRLVDWDWTRRHADFRHSSSFQAEVADFYQSVGRGHDHLRCHVRGYVPLDTHGPSVAGRLLVVPLPELNGGVAPVSISSDLGCLCRQHLLYRLPDLLVPWEIIVKRVKAAAQGDYVIVIYNPSSKKRIHQLQDTRKILLKYRSLNTPVAIIKGAYRESESIVITDLEHMEEYADRLGMISTVIVGNSSTYNFNDLMINPRGYKSKYNLQAEQKIQN